MSVCWIRCGLLMTLANGIHSLATRHSHTILPLSRNLYLNLMFVFGSDVLILSFDAIIFRIKALSTVTIEISIQRVFIENSLANLRRQNVETSQFRLVSHQEKEYFRDFIVLFTFPFSTPQKLDNCSVVHCSRGTWPNWPQHKATKCRKIHKSINRHVQRWIISVRIREWQRHQYFAIGCRRCRRQRTGQLDFERRCSILNFLCGRREWLSTDGIPFANLTTHSRSNR